jgi:hypothetical protein
MSELEEVIDTLWLYTTNETEPWTVDRAFQAIQSFGEVAIDGLIWGIEQDDLELQMLSLQLLRHYGTRALSALPALVSCIESEKRLVRLTAMESAGMLRASATSIIPLLLPLLVSEDEVERVMAAGNLLRIGRSEMAVEVLREITARPSNAEFGVAEFAVYYLRESEWDGRPPEDWIGV